jgi:hypothetical protein
MSIRQESTRPTTAESGATLAVHDEVSKFGAAQSRREDEIMTSLNVLPKSGEGESPLPEDKKEGALESSEDDWEHDPINPRNWPTRRKYVAMVLVRFILCMILLSLVDYVSGVILHLYPAFGQFDDGPWFTTNCIALWHSKSSRRCFDTVCISAIFWDRSIGYRASK